MKYICFILIAVMAVLAATSCMPVNPFLSKNEKAQKFYNKAKELDPSAFAVRIDTVTRERIVSVPIGSDTFDFSFPMYPYRGYIDTVVTIASATGTVDLYLTIPDVNSGIWYADSVITVYDTLTNTLKEMVPVYRTIRLAGKVVVHMDTIEVPVRDTVFIQSETMTAIDKTNAIPWWVIVLLLLLVLAIAFSSYRKTTSV